MRIAVLISITLAFALGGCASTGLTPRASSIVPGQPYTLSSAEQSAVKSGVTSALKDPTSALFGDMRAAQSADGVVTVCGYVNGKNSFGGYVGGKPFIGVLIGEGSNIGFSVVGMGGTDTETTVTYSVCRQSGINI